MNVRCPPERTGTELGLQDHSGVLSSSADGLAVPRRAAGPVLDPSCGTPAGRQLPAPTSDLFISAAAIAARRAAAEGASLAKLEALIARGRA